jgi:hypothetical protein
MSRPRANGTRHATLYDFRDLDLLMKLDAESDSDGWVETEALAAALGFDDDGVRNVGIRLGWMKRYGMIQRDERTGVWRLSPGGERVIEARLRAATKRELEKLDDESMIEVMANVAHRYRHADAMTATILRREFLFGTQRR